MKKLKEILSWAFVAVLVIFAIVVLIGSIAEYRACQESGGVLVRGMFGFECVARR